MDTILSVNPLSYMSKDYYFKYKILKNGVEIFHCDEKIDLKTFKTLAFRNIERSCNCSHDCCGHWFSRIYSIKKIGKNKFQVRQCYFQNY